LLTGIPGLAFRDSATARLQINAPRELNRDLDSLPLPAWDLIDAKAYRDAWVSAHGYFSLNMVSSRGCPFQCNWCSKPIHGDRYEYRSPRRVAEEMLFLKQTLRPNHIWFADDIFALSDPWTMQFADAVEELDASIPFKMQSRCDLMTRGTVDALQRAGCAEVWMGAESGSQKVLDAMEKGLRSEQVDTACESLRARGIRTGLFLQFGYPGESWEDIQSTIAMVRRTRPDDIGVSVSYPLPGTKFYQLVEAQLGQKQNWEDSDDLAMMFKGTYSTEFYRALRDALHREVSGAEAMSSIIFGSASSLSNEPAPCPIPPPYGPAADSRVLSPRGSQRASNHEALMRLWEFCTSRRTCGPRVSSRGLRFHVWSKEELFGFCARAAVGSGHSAPI
jgi:radical SAM superfamily enzyme YgiQ (UPF0313 family)